MSRSKRTVPSKKPARAANPARKKPAKKAHGVKKSKITKFLLVLGTLAVFLMFMLNKYGFEQGLEITLLVWTFFVLCTPLAAADLLLDVPLRLLSETRMIYSHAIVWFVALAINLGAMHFAPGLYEATPILSLLYHILTNPVPYWGLVGLCLIGTFLSLEVADEVVDEVEDKMEARHHRHHSMLHFFILAALIAGVLIIYDSLLGEMGMEAANVF
ncbi:MAG: hypothetical protein ABIH29_01875 [Candidatus Micrarchaeota archaeon]